jgi:hypothetical protein
MIYEERHLRTDGLMVELGVDSQSHYRLRYGRPGAWLVSYEDGRRTVKGRGQPYAFRSVEQLRYDFDKDVQDARRED